MLDKQCKANEVTTLLNVHVGTYYGDVGPQQLVYGGCDSYLRSSNLNFKRVCVWTLEFMRFDFFCVPLTDGFISLEAHGTSLFCIPAVSALNKEKGKKRERN